MKRNLGFDFGFIGMLELHFRYNAMRYNHKYNCKLFGGYMKYLKSVKFKHLAGLFWSALLIFGMITGFTWPLVSLIPTILMYLLVNDYFAARLSVASENDFRIKVTQDISNLKDMIGKVGIQINGFKR